MSCNCNETTKQGKQYCQECMPDEFHWLVPVSKEPDPFFMDRNHAYIDPNNIIYVLSRDRVRAIKITTSEGNIDLSPYALKEEPAQGFYWPKWTGTEWVEGGVAPEPTESEPQVSTMEEMAIALMKTQAELEVVQEALDFLIMGGI